MGYLQGDTCFNTVLEATAAYIGTSKAITFTPGSTTYLSTLSWDSATATYRHMTYQVATNGLWTLKTNVGVATPSFPSCDVLPPVADLATAFGGGFILPMAVFLVAYSAGTLANFFNHDR